MEQQDADRRSAGVGARARQRGDERERGAVHGDGEAAEQPPAARLGAGHDRRGSGLGVRPARADGEVVLDRVVRPQLETARALRAGRRRSPSCRGGRRGACRPGGRRAAGPRRPRARARRARAARGSGRPSRSAGTAASAPSARWRATRRAAVARDASPSTTQRAVLDPHALGLRVRRQRLDRDRDRRPVRARPHAQQPVGPGDDRDGARAASAPAASAGAPGARAGGGEVRERDLRSRLGRRAAARAAARRRRGSAPARPRPATPTSSQRPSMISTRRATASAVPLPPRH